MSLESLSTSLHWPTSHTSFDTPNPLPHASCYYSAPALILVVRRSTQVFALKSIPYIPAKPVRLFFNLFPSTARLDRLEFTACRRRPPTHIDVGHCQVHSFFCATRSCCAFDPHAGQARILQTLCPCPSTTYPSVSLTSTTYLTYLPACPPTYLPTYLTYLVS